MSDEINLDSPKELKEMMIRSVRLLPSQTTAKTLLLLGIPPAEGIHKYEQALDDPETMLNSRSGRIYLFPASQVGTPLAFRNFQARGGFIVTASRNTREVEYLEIQSRRNMDCHLMNPWPGKQVVVRNAANNSIIHVKKDITNGECLIFSTDAGCKYIIQLKLL
jgi:hypothetical protein